MERPGILALQGGFAAHEGVLKNLGYKPLLVKCRQELNRISCLIIPGGESTVMYRLLQRMDMWDDLSRLISEGLPVFGTCAGMIMLSSGVENSDQPTLSAMDYRVTRNAYGRQKDSFETDLIWGGDTVPALFIRAPRIHSLGENTDVMASHEEVPVLVRQNNCLAASFHPELTGYTGIHRYFLETVASSKTELLPVSLEFDKKFDLYKL